MNNFEYRISVIVPIYNAEQYLRLCLNSLVKQTISQADMQVLLIDDGSTDDSVEICREYVNAFDCFELYSKDNEGLSATRNYGMKRALGKYICFLDSDDEYSEETLKNICDFFDDHYDEIDEVTFPIVRYKDGKSLPLHYRYKYLSKTGIYDINDIPYISQTNINVCVKNLLARNVPFDETPDFRHEDQAFNNDVLRNKMKIGFVKEAEYKYNRNNESSLITKYMFPLYIFETTMAYYEKLFDGFDGEVPEYYQTLYMNDLDWKLRDDKLFPYHYEEKEFKQAVGRIKKLLEKVKPEIIINHPMIDNFHIQYWLNLKPNVYPVVIADPDVYGIYVDGKCIYKRKDFEVIMHKIRIKDGKLRLLGFVKSPIYNYMDNPADIYVVENNEKRHKLDPFISVHSFYKTKFTKTNKFYAFDYYCDTNLVKNFYFEVELDGIVFSTRFWCMPVAVFNKNKGITSYIRENTLISLNENVITLNMVDADETERFEHHANNRYKNETNVFLLRENALSYRKNHKVWLYYDAYTVKKDNAYFQFRNDLLHSKDDGIERYYVLTNEDSSELFTEQERENNVVVFGSEKHKLLYLAADKVLTGYYGFSTISPFLTETEEAKYIDIIKFETIYLQHGVLHAALHAYNAVERCRAERIVVSSKFEVKNYINNYNYKREDLITTGAARYDLIDKSKKPQKKILFAPSWRKYLTISETASKWELLKDKLFESEYFNNMVAFLKDEKLHSLLNRFGVYLDIKLHPIIAGNYELFEDEIISDHIKLISLDTDVHVEDYSMFITDFSSYVFDFAYLSRPIIYYVTDYLQFKSGMNHYKELDLDFKDAFGPMYTEKEDVIKYMTKIIKEGFAAEIKYKERMDSFFLPLDNCRESLYNILMEK